MTLLAIFTFIALTLGSFIWFVATWDAETKEPVSLILPKILPPEAPSLATQSIATNIAPMTGTVGGAHLAKSAFPGELTYGYPAALRTLGTPASTILLVPGKPDNSGARPSPQGAKA